jgi:heterodisulfide reductase subunit C
MCVELCPKGVAPMNRILQMREMAIHAGIQNNAGARHTNIFTKSIVDGGRLNEVWMVPGSVGMFNVPRLMSEMPGALKMLRVGKLPIAQMIPPGAPGSHKIKGMDRVRNLVRKASTLKPKKAEVTD